MRWSFSTHRTFKKCPRQWYFKNILANGNAKDPVRKEATRLGKLTSIHAWRGKIVDHVLSEVVIPGIGRRQEIAAADAKRIMKRNFDAQRPDAGGSGFLEIEYGRSLQDADFEKAWIDAERAMDGFFANDSLLGMLRQASTLMAQRILCFGHDFASVQAMPDLIVFFRDRSPLIVDWKVNYNPVKDYWLQLATYAIALSRCKPHRDWPVLPADTSPQTIELIEAQLLTGETRRHTVSDEDVRDVESLIATSSSEMTLLRGDRPVNKLEALDFPVTNNPSNCERCPFKKMCWESAQ